MSLSLVKELQDKFLVSPSPIFSIVGGRQTLSKKTEECLDADASDSLRQAVYLQDIIETGILSLDALAKHGVGDEVLCILEGIIKSKLDNEKEIHSDSLKLIEARTKALLLLTK